LTDLLALPLFEPAHRALAERLAAFAADVIEPRAAAADTGDPVAIGRDFIRAAADAGILPLFVAGGATGDGARADLRALCLAREAIAAASGFADSVYAVQGLGTFPIAVAGDAGLSRRYLPAATSGTAVGAFALTEPDAGSDPAGIATTATADGDSYVLTGRKTLISNAGLATFYIVFAQSDPSAGRKGLSAFVVDAETPGFRVVRQIELIAPHPIGELAFDECRVPASHRLGVGDDGLKIALKTLDFFRSSVGAAACGMAQRAVDEAVRYARHRRQFGSLIADFQATKIALADMATDLDAARLLVYRAAWTKDVGADRVTREASMAKLFATEAAQRIVDRAVQIHGGLGVQRGVVVERLYREVRALRIYEGTSEIQRLDIAERVLAESDSARTDESDPSRRRFHQGIPSETGRSRV
jgi:acyl-CoA dehydrogenase